MFWNKIQNLQPSCLQSLRRQQAAQVEFQTNISFLILINLGNKMIILYLIGLIIKRNVLGRNRSNGGNSNNGTNPAKPKMVSLPLISNWSSNWCHHVSDDHNCHGLSDNRQNRAVIMITIILIVMIMISIIEIIMIMTTSPAEEPAIGTWHALFKLWDGRDVSLEVFALS